MDKLTDFLTKPFLNEGINDPGIFKAVFLAGGPGSGKSYVVSQLFGIPEKVNISASGLKMVNQDRELEMLLKKYYGTVDLANMPVELFRQLADPRYDDYSGLRHFAKSLSLERLRLYVEGRLGVIIDGTGHKFKSVQGKRQKLMSVGYDTFMVFVNTSLEVALERNERRPRALPEQIVRKSWEDVQKNMGYFQGMFGMSRFMIVQNDSIESVAQSHKRFGMLAKKGVNKFLKTPLGKTAKDWVEKQKQIKKIGVKDLAKKVKMAESIKIDVNVGDTIKVGRFKNKKIVVKTIGKDKHGMPTINGKPVVKFRMAKDKDFLKSVDEAPRKPRKKGQHRQSSSHSDLYTDENPKGTIKGLKFATVADAKASVSKINGSGKSHAHKIQAAVAMEQRAREMGKSSQAAVYRAYINKMKKKTKEKNEEFGAPAGFLPSPSRKSIDKYKTKNKVMGNIDECITFANKFGNDVVLGKNRDRNYSPNIMMVRELVKEKTEICYLMDKDTDWCEGINSHGIGIVNSALFVKRDEKEFDKTKKIKAPSKDGARIREALSYGKISDVVRSLVTFHEGIKGHTIVSDGKRVAVIENTSRVKPYVTIHNLQKPLVRTNHGIKHPEQGYTRGPDRISSETRMKYAKELVNSTNNYKEVFPKFYNHTQKLGPKYDIVRSQNQLWTSSQLLVNLNKLSLILYLIPGKVHFKGIVNKLPENYKPKISLEVRQYEHSPDDKYDTYITTDKVKKPDIIDKRVKIKETLDLYMKNVVYSIVENEDNTTNLKEQKIKKVIGVFGGRFQPFHSGHLATYKWLKSKVDEAYITTSNIKQPPRHPMNFQEKVRHMVKMGIPKNRIIEERTPYVAKNLLKKFNPETTAVVYAFGQKDAGRLKGGTKKSGGKTYYQDYKKSKGDVKGFEEHGYFVTAPQFGSVSGTQMRQLLGSPKIDDSEREKAFKKSFGYFDKGIYQMMTNKFKKLFESFVITNDLIEEFLLEATGTFLGNLDDGPSTYFTDIKDYEESTKNWIDNIYGGAGWKIIDYMVSDRAIDPKDNIAKADTEHTRRKPGKKHYVSTDVTHLDSGQAKGSVTAVDEYKAWMEEVVKPLGWKIIDWMGTSAAIDNIIGSIMAAGADGFSYEVKQKENFHEQINSLNVLTQKNRGKELLLMGGAYGHLNHPFDNKNLTFSDFKTLIINTLQGNLSSEGTVTEKTDGQNIMISWKNNKLIAARNKGHIKNFGAGALDIGGVKSMFSGRGDIEKAFVYAMRDLERAIGGLSPKQKDKIFAEGKKFMSLEVIYPKTANVIPYDKSLLQFHGTIEYDETGNPIGDDRDSARMLAGMIKQINQNIQKTYSITKPFVTSLPKVKNFSQRQSYFLGKLARLQNRYGLGDKDTLSDYHQAYWMEYIYNGAKQTDYKHPDNRVLMKLTKRWAFFDKSYKIPQIKKDLKDYPKFLDWVLTTDKMNHARLQKEHIRDWEVLFFELGAEILSNLKDFIAANPTKAAQQIKKDLSKAISKVRTSKDPKVLLTLKTQLDRLNAIGGLKAVVPSEGITFMFKGKLYKYTGAFAPANQILGMLKFV